MISTDMYIYRYSLPIINIFSVSFIFGAITMTSGILGVPLGSYLSTKLSKRYPRADPIICAVGLLLSAPLLAASMILVTVSAPLAYIAVFLGQIALNLNWAIVADMLLVRIYYFCLFSKLLPHLYLHYYSLFSNYFCLPVS